MTGASKCRFFSFALFREWGDGAVLPFLAWTFLFVQLRHIFHGLLFCVNKKASGGGEKNRKIPFCGQCKNCCWALSRLFVFYDRNLIYILAGKELAAA
jgi:hypothetical protein